MSVIRSVAAAIYHKAFPALRRVGLDFNLRRNSAYRIVGVQTLWGKDEPNITRGMIVEHVLHDHKLRFFISNDNDLVQQCHLMGSFFEERELAIIKQHYRGGVFVDVGANVGNHSLFAIKVLDAPKVIAFEPNPPAFRVLEYNILLNNLGDRIELRPVGLSNVAGKAALSRSPDRNLGATALAPSSDGNLELVRGDDVLGSIDAGFIKIDVETLEMSVLEGLQETIARCRPVMLVEVDRPNTEAFRLFVDKAGYRVLDQIELDENFNALIGPAPRQ